jgi:AcrR family transcriptional regulator
MPLPANRYRPGARQRGEDTSRRILETALALFAAEGFDSTSTRAIAEQAGVNLPAIQYYFGSKEGLYRAAIAHIGEQAAQAIAPIAARVRGALDTGAPSRAQLIEPSTALVGRLVDRPAEDEQVVLRTLMILGQTKIFCSRSVVRALGWDTVGDSRLREVKAMVHQHTRAICRSLKGAAA